jgi:hypothetical protein
MIAIRTRAAWSTCEIELDNGIDPAETWTCPATVADAYAAVEDFAAWVDATFAGESTSWSWTRDPSTGGCTLSIVWATNPYDVTANSAAQSILGSDTGLSGASEMLWASPSGSLAPAPLVSGATAAVLTSRALQWAPGPARAASVGAVRSALNATASTRLRCDYPATAGDVAELRAALEVAVNPRTASIYDPTIGAWRTVSLGRARVDRSSPDHWRVALDVQVSQ